MTAGEYIGKRMKGIDSGLVWDSILQFPGGTEKNHERSLRGLAVFRPRIKPETSVMRSKWANDATMTFSEDQQEFTGNVPLTFQSPVVAKCTTRFNILKLPILPTGCTSVFRMVLTLNNECLPKEHFVVAESRCIPCWVRAECSYIFWSVSVTPWFWVR
jgi:hypothetical protein